MADVVGKVDGVELSVGVVVKFVVGLVIGVVFGVVIDDPVGSGFESELLFGMRTARRMIKRMSEAAPTMMRIFAVLE